MAQHGYFVTGTDTAVGKTVVTAAVTAVLRRCGLWALPMKVVQTGATECGSGLRSPDLDFCLEKLGLVLSRETYEALSPCKLSFPASPHLAAQLEGRTLRVSGLCDAVRRAARYGRCLVVEGAGGVLVPLNGTETMLDLICEVGLPVLLVARRTLGTINHTLLSVHEIRRRGAPLAGVVFCETEPCREGVIERDNEATIAQLGEVRVCGRMPFCKELPAVAPERFCAWAAEQIPADFLVDHPPEEL